MENKKVRFIILGVEWFDKNNNNSYNNAKIIDLKTNKTYYKGFNYGYGNSYYYDAINFIKKNIKKNVNKDIEVLDMGIFPISKKNAKNNNF